MLKWLKDLKELYEVFIRTDEESRTQWYRDNNGHIYRYGFSEYEVHYNYYHWYKFKDHETGKEYEGSNYPNYYYLGYHNGGSEPAKKIYDIISEEEKTSLLIKTKKNKLRTFFIDHKQNITTHYQSDGMRKAPDPSDVTFIGLDTALGSALECSFKKSMKEAENKWNEQENKRIQDEEAKRLEDVEKEAQLRAYLKERYKC